MSITPDYWTDAALARLRAALAEHAAPRHSFGRKFSDWPSLQPERIPSHRAPKHRADVAEDSCVHWPSAHSICPDCRWVPAGKYRADVAS